MERIRGYRLLLTLLGLSLLTLALTGDVIWTPEPPSDATDDDPEAALQADEAADESGDGEAGGEPEGDAAPEAARMPAEGDTAGQDSRLLPDPRLMVAVAAAVVTVGIVTTLVGGLAVSEGVRTGLLLALAGPLLAKRHRGERATLSRGRILGFIEAHPGIHFSALRDGLELANGVTSHHLHRLQRDGRIVSWADGTRRRFAASGIDPETAETLAHPVTGMQRAILEILTEAGELGITAADLRRRVEATRQLVSYHLGRLDSRGLIDRAGRGRSARWTLTDAGHTLITVQSASAI